MSKVTVTLQGSETNVLFEELIHASDKTMLLKKASIVWLYKNLPVDTVFTFDKTPNIVGAGYWTFAAIKKMLEKKSGISVEALSHNGKCKLSNILGTFTLDLGERLATLLGGFTSTTFGPNTTRVSVGQVNVNNGLEVVRVRCSALDLAKNQVQNKRSNLLTSLPVTSKQPLYGTTQEFFDVESKVALRESYVWQLTITKKMADVHFTTIHCGRKSFLKGN